jgi:PPOX class probable F420-dependent enzyme
MTSLDHIPDDYKKLFESKSFATFATLMPDGSPHLTVVWIDSEENFIYVNAARGRQKVKNVQRDPTVSLLIMDPNDPYRYLTLSGEVVEVTEQGAVEHYNKLGLRYLETKNLYQKRHGSTGSTRVLLRIHPKNVTTWSMED